MYKESLAEFEKELAIFQGNTQALSELGDAYAVGGRTVKAQKVLGQLNEILKQTCVPAACRAIVYADLGGKEKAFEWLEKGYEERCIGVGGALIVDPGFDPLRSDPRFADLLRRMNLQQ